MKQYALISPVAGIEKDIPSILIPNAYSIESENIVFDDGMVIKATGKVVEDFPPLNEKILLLYNFIQSQNNDFLIVGTQNKIYKLTPSDSDIVPTMTSNNTPAPYVISASSEPAGGSGYAWNAFDDDLTTYWTPSSDTDEWIKVDLGNEVKVKKVRIKTIPSFGIKNFKVQGSNDDINWTDLYVGIANDTDDWQEFNLTTTGKFRYYRIYIIDGYFPDNLFVNEIELLTDYAWEDITGGVFFTTQDVRWQFTTFFDSNLKKRVLILSNGVQHPYKWTGEGNIQPVNGNLPICKYLCEYKGYLMLGNIFDTDGTNLPSNIRWSSIGEYENWTGGDSGEASIGGVDEITGLAKVRDYLLIFKEKSIYLLSLTSGITVFSIGKLTDSIGCVAPNSIVSINDRIYFFGNDYKFYMTDGVSISEISSPIDSLISEMDFNQIKDLMYGVYLEGLNRILWLYPTSNSPENDKALLFDLKTGAWSTLSFSGTVITRGGYKLKEPDLKWSDLTNTWDEQTKKWNSISYLTGQPVNLIADENGNIYRLFGDNDISLTGTFISKKLSFDTPTIYKRLLLMKHYFKKEVDENLNVSVSIRKDEESDFKNPLEISLQSSNDELIIADHYIDITGRTFEIKVSGNGKFRYLGTLFFYNTEGLR